MKQLLKKAVGLLVLIALIATYLQYGDTLTVDNIQTFVQSFGTLAPLAFGVIYILITLVGISAAAFTVLSGVLFGNLLGSVVVVTAATISAVIAFILARTFGKKVTTYLETSSINPLIQKVNTQCEEGGFKAFFILRCLFLPYIPLSYAAGLVKTAQLKDFALATLLTNMIFTPVFVYFGDNLTKGPKALILPAILIGVVLLVPRITKRLRK